MYMYKRKYKFCIPSKYVKFLNLGNFMSLFPTNISFSTDKSLRWPFYNNKKKALKLDEK